MNFPIPLIILPGATKISQSQSTAYRRETSIHDPLHRNQLRFTRHTSPKTCLQVTCPLSAAAANLIKSENAESWYAIKKRSTGLIMRINEFRNAR